MYVHRRSQEEEGNAAAVMLPMEKVLQLKAVKVVSRTITIIATGFVFQRLQRQSCEDYSEAVAGR